MGGYRNLGGGSSGGGGTGLVTWGPNFGTPGGDSLPQVQSISMPAIGLSMDLPQIQAIRNTNIGLSSGVAQIQALAMELGLVSGVTQRQTLGITLGLLTGVAQTQAIANPAIGLLPNVAQAHTLGAKILAGPFWRSVQTMVAGPPSVTVTKPTDTVAGDLLVAFASTSALTSNPFLTPSGWTLIRSDVVAGVGTAKDASCFYKIAGASEPADYTFQTTASGGGVIAEIHRIIGTDPTTPINAHNGATLLAAALVPDPVSPSVTTTAVNCLVFAHLLHDHLTVPQTHTAPASHVERTDFESGAPIICSTTDTRLFASAAATGTAVHDCTETISTDGIMQRVAIAPSEIIL